MPAPETSHGGSTGSLAERAARTHLKPRMMLPTSGPKLREPDGGPNFCIQSIARRSGSSTMRITVGAFKIEHRHPDWLGLTLKRVCQLACRKAQASRRPVPLRATLWIAVVASCGRLTQASRQISERMRSLRWRGGRTRRRGAPTARIPFRTHEGTTEAEKGTSKDEIKQAEANLAADLGLVQRKAQQLVQQICSHRAPQHAQAHQPNDSRCGVESREKRMK